MPTKRLPSKNDETIEQVAGILENYANRGVFRGFTRGPVRAGKAIFQMVWHHDRRFELILQLSKGTMNFPLVLPGIPADSAMYAEFKEFLESRHSDEVPEHRRIDPGKVQARCINKGGNISVTLTVKDGDYEYAARKSIHLVDEIFKVFLGDGPYYEYQVENLGLDPDRY